MRSTSHRTTPPRDRRGSDHRRREEVGRDEVAEREAEDGGRDSHNNEVSPEANLPIVRGKVADTRDEVAAIEPEDGDHRTELDHDRGDAVDQILAQELGRHDQVARGRDGQELGEALNDAQVTMRTN